MKDTIDTATRIAGVGLIAYVTSRYGPRAAILMILFGVFMTAYVMSEHIEHWLRNRGEG